MGKNTDQLVPPGWVRSEVIRKSGLGAGKIDIYVTSPKGRLLRSKKQLSKYLETSNFPYKIEDFNFSVSKKLSMGSICGSESKSNILIETCQSESFSSLSDSLNQEKLEISQDSQQYKQISQQKTDKLKLTDATTNTEPLNNVTSLSIMEGEWLADEALSSYYSILDTMIKKRFGVCLLKPVISHAVGHLEDVDLILVPLCLNDEKYIFIPINDSESLEEGNSGMHWSLLV